MEKLFSNQKITKEATLSDSHQVKVDMHKAVMKRKLTRDDDFTAQFKVRDILEAAINNDN